MPSSSRRSSSCAHLPVVIDHRVVIRRLPAARLAEALRLGVSPPVHVGRVDPAEERLAGRVLPLHEVAGSRDEIVVAGFHALAGQRTRILDLLLADPAPARLLRRVVHVGRPAVQHAARSVGRLEFRELLRVRIVAVLGLFLRVEVIEVAEELVEPVHRRQVLVHVAEVVLAELAGRVSLHLQQFGNRRVLRLQADVHARGADFRQARAEDALPGDECGPAGGAALFAVGIREQHAFGRETVDVGRVVSHHATAVAREIPDADVVTPDDEDVWFSCLCHVSLLSRGMPPLRDAAAA